jgi:membrane-associated phospholipid phosphatase
MPSIPKIVLSLLLTGLVNSVMRAQNAEQPMQESSLSPPKSSVTAPSASGRDSIVTSRVFGNRMESEADEESKYELMPGEDPQNHLVLPFVNHLATDQKNFWTAPAHMQKKDIEWIAPFAGVTAGFIASDSWLSKQIPLGEIQRSKKISNYAVYSLIGAGAGSFLFGHMTGNDQMSEAGLLSGEAAMNSTAVAYLLKSVTRRPRPFQANGIGTFFQGGSSFPSEHAAIAWSVASVLAHEYPGTLSQILAYGLATTVSATRVTGQQHFTSDVIIGSALGWYFGQQVYRAHHDTDLGGAAWGNVLPENYGDKTRNPANMGSASVPLDSWIYPALERLVALGYIKTAYLGIRPWTRIECARMLEEAEQRIGDEDEQGGEAPRIYSELSKELSDETNRLNGAANAGASLDSVYVRATSISGAPLRDGYHFGQTFVNDYGRPYGRGFNAISGVTAHAEAGPLSISVRGEYQHAPMVRSDPASVLQSTASADFTLPLPNGTSELNRLRLLDSVIGFTWNNIQFSFGQQSLWLGPGDAGPFLFSNNAEPITMLRIDSVSPYEVPLISRLLGPVRSEFFLGQLSGQHWEFSPILFGPNLNSQPFIHGTKFSFHPSANIEFGLGFTAQFGGPGNPFTWGNFLRTFYSHKVGIGRNPGKRLSEFDFTYRIPGLRNWAQVYADSMVIDEYSPLVSNRPAINPGIYFPRLPKLPKMDLRLEGVTTDLNVPAHFGPGAFYWDERYHSGYTNNGNLLGDWVGRRARGEQGWLTYRFSPRSYVQFEYRHSNVDKGFLEGGSYQDFSLRADVMLRHDLGFSGSVQHENWQFPLLGPSRRSDVTTSVQLTWWPDWKTRKSK